MNLINMLKSLLNLFPSQTVFAHCDIPCGIYDPTAAQTAAKTILVMVQKINAEPEPLDDNEAAIKYTNNMVRMIMNKEEHAAICKKELSILWSDYFKEEHLEKFPDLHDKFWKALKLCSKNKQSVDENLAQQLVKAVDEIAQMFVESKK